MYCVNSKNRYFFIYAFEIRLYITYGSFPARRRHENCLYFVNFRVAMHEIGMKH